MREKMAYVKTAFKLISAVLSISLIAVLGVYASINIPSFESVRSEHVPSLVVLKGSDGEVLDAVRLNKQVLQKSWTPVSDVSPIFKQVLLVAEDKRFDSHTGVDYLALASALKENLYSGSVVRGGSTLSMQTADLLTQTVKRKGSRGILSKVYQSLYAVKLERSWSKSQIFEAYLNKVWFKGELRGVAAASDYLFNKSAANLGFRESAVLAAMVRNPAASSKKITQRALKLLISANAPSAQLDGFDYWVDLALIKKPSYESVHEAPVLANNLAQGCKSNCSQLNTSIDSALQKFVNIEKENRLIRLAGQNVSDAAVVVLDNKSGQVRAYSTTSINSKANQVDTAASLRQAGSTLKPFIYGAAFEERYLTPASLLLDSKLQINVDSAIYEPKNYTNKFTGLVSARTALAASMNIPAVKVVDIITPEKGVKTLESVGVPVPHDADYYGEGLALGSLDVTLINLTNAYRSLIREGQFSDVCFLKDCKTNLRSTDLSKDAAWLILSILSDNAARSVTFGPESVLNTPYWTAVKTGTSKDMRDNWTIGVSDQYTVGVWVGNANGEPMHDVSGVTGAAPLWRAVMDYLHSKNPSVMPLPPENVICQHIQYIPAVQASKKECFIKGTQRAVIQAVLDQDLLDAGDVKISNPVNGAVLAIDPDVPKNNQMLVLKASTSEGVVWKIDGKEVTPYWTPTPGRHLIEVLNASTSEVLDTATIFVKSSKK